MSYSGPLSALGGSAPGSGVLTISGDNGTPVSPDGLGDIALLGTGIATVTENAGANSLDINSFANSDFIVSTDPDQGNYTTIQSAVNAASAIFSLGITVWVKEGIYTEDITLPSGVNLAAVGNNKVISTFAPVTIIGKLTNSGLGSSSIYGIAFSSDADYSIEVDSSATIFLNDCYIQAVGNDAIHVDGGFLYMNNCKGSPDSPHKMFLCEGGGTIRATYSAFTGGSGTPSTLDGGYFEAINCYFAFPFETLSAGQFTLCSNTVFDCSSLNDTCIENLGTGISRFTDCSFYSGSAPSLSVDTGGTIHVNGGAINSTAANAITGLGEIKCSGISFTNTSSNFDITTLTPFDLGPIITSSQQPMTTAYLSTSTANDKTGDGIDYPVIMDQVFVNNFGAYDVTSGIYTVPFTGNYDITWNCQLTNVPAMATQWGIFVQIGSIGGFYGPISLPSISQVGANMKLTLRLNKADTIQFYVFATGSTRTAGVAGEDSSMTYPTFATINMVN